MLENVNCHFTFGVFTKWDVYAQPEEDEEEDDDDEDDEGKRVKEEMQSSNGKEKQARELYENNFRDSVNQESDVYFVDVKEILTKKKVSILFCDYMAHFC